MGSRVFKLKFQEKFGPTWTRGLGNFTGRVKAGCTFPNTISAPFLVYWPLIVRVWCEQVYICIMLFQNFVKMRRFYAEKITKTSESENGRNEKREKSDE